MKCSKCHTENPANSIKCTKCGHILNVRKTLGLRFYSQILFLAFFIITIVGVFGPMLTNIRGLLSESQVRWNADFSYFFSGMWSELLAYHGSSINGYGLAFTKCLIMSISCILAIGGVLATLLVSSIRMFTHHHKNQYARLSIRKMYLYSFIPALQYLVLNRFFFYSAQYNAFTGYTDMTHMGWGGILIIIGLVFGFAAVVIEEVPHIEKADLPRYTIFRAATALLAVIAFVGTASYIHYTYASVESIEPYPVIFNLNVFDTLTKAYVSATPEVLGEVMKYAIPAIVIGFVGIIAIFFALYHTFTRRRVALWISIDALVLCSVACGILSRLATEELYIKAAGDKYVTTLGTATTNTIAIAIIFAIILAYDFLKEKGININIFSKIGNKKDE